MPEEAELVMTESTYREICTQIPQHEVDAMMLIKGIRLVRDEDVDPNGFIVCDSKACDGVEVDYVDCTVCERPVVWSRNIETNKKLKPICIPCAKQKGLPVLE